MTFAGLPRGKERADVIAYLNTQVRQSGAAAEEAAAPAAEKQRRAARPSRRGEANAGAEAPKPH